MTRLLALWRSKRLRHRSQPVVDIEAPAAGPFTPDTSDTNLPGENRISLNSTSSPLQIRPFSPGEFVEEPPNMVKKDASVCSDLVTSRKKGYLDLPPELRNQIMGLSLKHNCVILPAERDRHQMPRHKYGAQMLATCREVYKEAHPVLYSNEFVVLSCSFREMKQILGSYQKKHFEMMSDLTIGATVKDVEDAVVGEIVKSVREEWALWTSISILPPTSHIHGLIRDKFTFAIKKEWYEKAFWLRNHLPYGNRMSVQTISVFDNEQVQFDIPGTEVVYFAGNSALCFRIGNEFQPEVSEAEMVGKIDHAFDQLVVWQNSNVVT